MGIEFELKYSAKEETILRLSREITGQQQRFHMRTTYYDTPSGALAARYCTLRCRKENDSSVCTLKTPAGTIGRREWEVPCDRIEAGVEAFRSMGAPEQILDFTKEGLIPVCGAEFHRIAITVELPGTVLELALDRGVLRGGSREIPLSEVEVELKSGSEATCMAYAAGLAAKYGLVPESRSKFSRALALQKGE